MRLDALQAEPEQRRMFDCTSPHPQALPWITTLSVIVRLPSVAHSALNYRRALLVYDEQGACPSSASDAAPDPDAARKPAAKPPLVLSILGSLPLVAMLFMYATPGLVIDGKRPWLAAIRSWVPFLLLCFFTLAPLLHVRQRSRELSWVAYRSLHPPHRF